MRKRNQMKTEKYARAICFGEVLWDMLPTSKKSGGASLNVAIHLEKQGQNLVLIRKTGLASQKGAVPKYSNKDIVEILNANKL